MLWNDERSDSKQFRLPQNKEKVTSNKHTKTPAVNIFARHTFVASKRVAQPNKRGRDKAQRT